MACSSSGAFRQMIVSTGRVTTWAQPYFSIVPSLSAPARKRKTASSDASARASATPRESCLARVAMLGCSPVSGVPFTGISSQPMT